MVMIVMTVKTIMIYDYDYSWLPFEQGRFRAEPAERAQVQIARVTTPEFHYYNEI